MRKITTLLFAICIGIAAFAVPETITVGEDASTASYALPFDSEVATDKSSVSQQLYTQSDLGVSAKSISKITFYIKNKSTSSDLVSISRNVQVWMNEIDLVGDSFPINKTGENVALFGFVYSNCTYKPGTKVYEGSITTPALSAGGENTYDVTFSTPFVWSGTKSALILTVYDVTKTNVGAANLRHIIKSVNEPRFILARDFVDVDAIDSYVSSLYGKYGTWYGNTHTVSGQCTSHKWVNKITFTYTDAPAAPSSPSVSNISGSSATISWTAASDAEAYEIRYSTSVCGLNEASPINVNNVTSYTLGGLETSTKYYYQIRTQIGSNYSAWTAESNFTTTAHIHKGITFEKYNSTSQLPAYAGNYYLTNDITLSDNWTPNGNINLCLNGHTVTMGVYYGYINGKTVAIYDEEGGGKITSSNSDQTLLVDGGYDGNLFIYADIENTGTGRKVKAQNGATAAIDEPISLSDAADNTSVLTENDGLLVKVNMIRSLTASQYNTFCLPFSLNSNSLMEYYFGTGYELWELTGSDLDGDVLSLTFTSKSSLEAGKPYLIKPAHDVVNPSFEGVTIAATSAGTTTTEYIDFKGIYSPTELTGGNKNLLFLGADNELFWPETTGTMNGFRAYFEVKGAAQKAAKHARIVYSQDAATSLDQTESARHKAEKFIRNGQLYLMYNGAMYDVQGRKQR